VEIAFVNTFVSLSVHGVLWAKTKQAHSETSANVKWEGRKFSIGLLICN